MRLREWQYMSKPGTKAGSASAAKTNKEKFADLLDYIIKHKPDYTTDTYVNRLDDTGFEYEEHRALGDIEIDYDIRVEVALGKNDLFTIHVFKNDKQIESLMPKGWADFLRYLKIYFPTPQVRSSEYISLTEAFSIADDFELYENLWD